MRCEKIYIATFKSIICEYFRFGQSEILLCDKESITCIKNCFSLKVMKYM